MKPPEQVLRVAVLAVPESTASTLYGMCDLLASAARDWAALIEGRQAKSANKLLDAPCEARDPGPRARKFPGPRYSGSTRQNTALR